MKKSAKERRKDFGKNIDMRWYHTCSGKVPPVYTPSKDEKIIVRNVMSNEDRRKMRLKQDPNLPDYKENK